MSELFLKLLNMSIAAGWLVLAVILLRASLYRAPKAMRCVLWAMVGLRLVLPFGFESALSLIPSVETIPPSVIGSDSFDVNTGIKAIDSRVNEYLDDRYYEGVTVPEGAGADFISIVSLLWLAGVVVLLAYTAISYLKLRRRVFTAVLLKDNIRQSENVSSPFILGVFRPLIYLPFAMNEKDMAYVLAHENAHLKRRDNLIKPLAFLILSVYWFNPMIWLAYILLCRDIELACDERVIKDLGENERRGYGEALLSCCVSRRNIAACPLAFGEVGVKERIKTVLNYRKPAFWLVLAAGVACIALAVCFLTNPKSKSAGALPEIYSHSYGVEKVAYQSPFYSFSMVVGQNTPVYAVTEDMKILSKKEYSPGDEWTAIGELSPFDLTKDNFDGLFQSDGWDKADKLSAASIRKNTARSWRTVYGDDVLYYLLQQKNGEIYLAYGYYDIEGITDPYSDDSSVRWLYKLAVDITEDMGNVVISGENVAPVVIFAPETPISDMKNSLYWLEIAPYPNNALPFQLYGGAKEFAGGLYAIYDCETYESLEFFTPSGLSPQTYIFQNAKRGRDYIVTMRYSDNAEIYCFGARLTEPSYYRYSFTVYINPLSSYLPVGTTGLLYLLEDKSLTFFDDKTGETRLNVTFENKPWEQMSLEEWAGMFMEGEAPDISGIVERRMKQLTDKYYLFDMDGGLWLGEYGDEQIGMWSVYELTLHEGDKPPAAAVTPDE